MLINIEIITDTGSRIQYNKERLNKKYSMNKKEEITEKYY